MLRIIFPRISMRFFSFLSFLLVDVEKKKKFRCTGKKVGVCDGILPDGEHHTREGRDRLFSSR